jgi:hypothetical protein
MPCTDRFFFFSELKCIKIRTRSFLRLDSLALIAIDQDITKKLTFDDVFVEFAKKTKKKMGIVISNECMYTHVYLLMKLLFLSRFLLVQKSAEIQQCHGARIFLNRDVPTARGRTSEHEYFRVPYGGGGAAGKGGKRGHRRVNDRMVVTHGGRPNNVLLTGRGRDRDDPRDESNVENGFSAAKRSKLWRSK